MAVSPGPQPVRPVSPTGNQLHSWKEIAAHLNTTVRTVQRWEKSEGLPAHRHLHAQRHSVYAYRTELDEWWASRGASLPRPAPPSMSRRPWVIAAVLVAALATGAFAWWLRRPAREQPVSAKLPIHVETPVQPSVPVPEGTTPPPPILKVRPAPVDQRVFSKAVPLTSYRGEELYPSFSPDGGQVAFSWNGEQQSNFDIYVQVVGSGAPLRVTTGRGADISPAWSPDGRAIAFLRRGPDQKAEVLLIPPLGGTERRLGEIYVPSHGFWAQTGHFLAWSLDSKWLAVAAGDSAKGPFRLILISVQTGESRPLTQPDPQSLGDLAPSFSPDGRSLAFSRLSSPLVGEIYRVDVASDLRPRGNPRPLTSLGQMTTSPVWTGDGRAVLFLSGNSPSTIGLWKILASGGKAEPLELGYTPVTTFARAEKRLVFSHRLVESDIWRVDLPAAAGGEAAPPVRLISSSRPDQGPQFSPDGSKIAFQSSRSGNPEIYVANRDGSNVLRLTAFGGPVVMVPRWSPDSRQVAFTASLKGLVQIYTVGAGGGAPRLIHSDPAAERFTNWSRDGRWIYFASGRTGEAQTWKAPVGGGAAVQVTRRGGFAGRESPDGRFVYYLKGLPLTLWRVPLGGGEETMVVDRLGGQVDFVDRGVYSLSWVAPAGAFLRFFDLGTGETRTVARFGRRQLGPFTVSPDERTLLFSRIEEQGTDLLLVENFQ